MTKPKIIVLGDSFTFGHGCSDRIYYFDDKQNKFIGTYLDYNSKPSDYCWASLLQNSLIDYEVINLSVPGCSMQGIFEILLKQNLDDVRLVIFNGTFFDRVQVPLSDKPEILISYIVHWQHFNDLEPEEYSKAKLAYSKYLYTEEIGLNQGLSALMAAHSYVSGHDIKFLWSLPFLKGDQHYIKKTQNSLKYLSHLTLPFIYKYDFSGKEDHAYNEQCNAVDGHVNELGHEIYFNKIILPAVQNIL